jgi:hypothetical protein
MVKVQLLSEKVQERGTYLGYLLISPRRPSEILIRTLNIIVSGCNHNAVFIASDVVSGVNILSAYSI